MSHPTDAAAIAGALIVAATAQNGVFLGGARLFARWARVAMTKAALGFGPRLFTVPFGGARLEVRLVPLNAYVQFAGANPYVEDPPPPPPRVLWTEASAVRRVLAFFVPPRLAAFAVAAAILRPGRAWTAIVDGNLDALAAFYGAGPLFDAAAAILAREGFVTLAAVTLAKCLAMNLWLFPDDLLMLAPPRHAKTAARIKAVTLLLGLAFAIAWAVAFFRWAA